MAADNKALGQFDLVGIPSAPRGVPQIEVTFDIDANGIVQVSAKDKATGKEQQIRIQASGGLSDDDIEQMVKDAEENADADKQARESVEVKNSAEGLIHATEKSLEEFGDEVPDEDKDNVTAAMDDLKAVMDGDDVEDIKAKTEALSQASMKLGEIAYRKAQEEQAGAPDSEMEDVTPSDSDDIEDAEVVDAEIMDLEVEDDDEDEAQKSA